jgi:hypothetical protein
MTARPAAFFPPPPNLSVTTCMTSDSALQKVSRFVGVLATANETARNVSNPLPAAF